MEHQAIIAAPAADTVPTILIAREALLGALATLNAVVERRNTIPILSGVLFEPVNDTGDGLALVGTDLDIRATIHVPAIFTDGCRFVAASCKALSDAVKACKADEITLELSGGKLRLTGAGYSTSLPTLPADDFPNMVRGDMAAEFMLPGRDVAHDFARLSPAISTEETRYYLNGIFAHATCDRPAAPSDEETALKAALDTLRERLRKHDVASATGADDEASGYLLDPEDVQELTRKIDACRDELKAMEAERCKPNVLKLKATDGHRLAIATRPLPDGAATLPDVIIPRKVIGLISRLVGKPVAEPKSVAAAVSQGRSGKYNRDVWVKASATKIEARVGNVTILAKLIDGSFPDVDRVIPTQNDRVLSLTGEELAAAAKGASAHCDEKTRAVRLDIGASETVFSATSPGNGTGRATVAAEFRTLTGEPAEDMVIGFNAAYLATMGTTFGNVIVDVHLSDAAAPTLFTSPAVPGFLAVLMPMRVDGGAAERKAAEPVKPAESPYDRFQRVYGAAWANRDKAGIVRAVAERRAAFVAAGMAPEKIGPTIACDAALIRKAAAASPAEAGTHIAADRRAEARLRTMELREQGFVARTVKGGGVRSPGMFSRLVASESALASLARLPGYDPADPRNVLPVEYDGLGLVYVAAHELRDVARISLPRRDAKGTVTRKRNETNNLWRDSIKAVVPAKMSSSDLARALLRSETDRRELSDRLARLESMVADLATRPAEPAPAAPPAAESVPEPEPEPIIAPAPAPEPSVLGTIIADLAERAEAAEAAAERASRPRGGLVAMIGRLRQRCVAAVRRANEAEAERDRALELAKTSDIALAAMAARAGRAEAELDKLQPLVAAIRAVAA